ncbi:NAD(P)-dependent dehydrogenase (short-subunit alcohol dehydrogenase family) [Novosphingobium sp. PhB165]|uniref:SDR family NAD(P)-dependent oxidoreductase n=1 Tax=Novosphingobium sp. PhB165 TaxID=2485105 RepID=UPI00104AC702|nr:SDR family oxidoreductase [Novosphingobium sp. PhB165]TCM14705.1 NAD(P)-dependent dehydrogenase (short-subunit alcohol dehydrogenase family) [Novosphingobium sp. PhB165]
MHRDLEERVAIVTGGSDGIGLATAALLARKGARVAICGRRQERLELAKAAIEAEGGTVEAIRLDVSDFDSLAAMIADIGRRHGRLDMLVNNAMSTHYAPIDRLTVDQWRKDFTVNADAAFVATKAAMRMMAQGDGGSIVNVASTCGIRAAANMASYSASKAALVHFSAVAAMEGAPLGIRVNAVVPGQVQTAGTEEFAARAPQIAACTAEAIPMGRGGRPEELARAIVFLLSDEASYVTGAALPVDGGKAAQLYLPS